MKRAVTTGMFAMMVMGGGAKLASAQKAPSYYVIDLGTLPAGSGSSAYAMNENRIAAGSAGLADNTQQAVMWAGPLRIDLGTPGLNSSVFGVNASGQAAISAEVSSADPNGENFCAFGTNLKCEAILWQRGVMSLLPTLGGTNANIGNINNKGEIPGMAETTTRDTTCPATPGPSGIGPLLYDFAPVIWGPKVGDIRTLKLPAGDTVGQALFINDSSQAVGSSGTCAGSSMPPLSFGSRAVMWQADGTPVELGHLGSTVINSAQGINNQGAVSGVSATTDKAMPGYLVHAFMWTSKTGMKDLGVLPGDAGSVGVSINDQGDVVGPSLDAEGNLRAFLWDKGTMYDLNDLAVNSALYLLCGEAINSRGEIAGFGATEKGEVHAFLAVPNGGSLDATAVKAAAGSRIALTNEVKKAVRERMPRGWARR